MTLSLQLDRADRRPLYQQIAAQIRNQISVGRLPPGTRLPPVRELARMLNVNRLTAHNAYSELQADGWVESTVGKGTYVIEEAQSLSLLSTVSLDLTPERFLQDINPIKQITTLRSLAYAEPDPSFAPTDDFWGAMVSLRREAASLMRYETPEGDTQLRLELTTFLRERGIEAMPDGALITSGAMQGLSLATQALAQRGDSMIIDQPTYPGMIHILKAFGVRPIIAPHDGEGPVLDQVERALVEDNPRALYITSTFHNPTGACLSARRRRDLLTLASQYNLPIVEDDVCGMLAYDGPPPPALKAQDRADSVIYVSSFSKMLMPGLRVGFMVPPPYLLNRLLSLRRATDLYGAIFTQRALSVFLQQGRLKAHLRRVIPVYRERRDALMRAMKRHLPTGVRWEEPSGGFATWVTLPQPNARAVHKAALHHGIAITPGAAFWPGIDNNRHLRLCFSGLHAEDFEPILQTLGAIIAEQSDNDAMDLDDPERLYAPLA